MAFQKFDPKKLERLNDPARFESIPPVRLWDALGDPADTKVIVEIGAGTGLFASAFAGFIPHGKVYATDIEDTMLDWMRENRPEVDGGRITPVKSAESHVPLDDGIADIVYMINLHHELAEPDALYAEAFRLLRAGGMLLVADWAATETPKGPPLAIRASASDLVGFCERAGFSEVSIHDGALPWHSLVTGRKSN